MCNIIYSNKIPTEVVTMFYEVISCRVAIQVCIGYTQNGRARYRTFSMRGIRHDASNEAIAAIIRALAPVLAYPITKVRKVMKRTIVFVDDTAPAAPAAALSVPVELAAVATVAMPEPLDSEPLLWELVDEAQFAFALLVMNLLWGWIIYVCGLVSARAERRLMFYHADYCIRRPKEKI